MKTIIKKIFKCFNLQLTKIHPAGHTSRPIGRLELFFEDLRARGFNPKGLIDVGACSGDMSMMFANIFPESKILMCEPQQELEEKLKSLCNDKIFYEKVLISGQERYFRQTVKSENDSTAVFEAVEPNSQPHGLLKATTFNHLMEKYDSYSFIPDVVLIDLAGGAQKDMLTQSGMERTKLCIVCCPLYEFTKGEPTVYRMMWHMFCIGFVMYDIVHYLRRPLDGALGLVYIAFIKKDANIGTPQDSDFWKAKS